jgi:hypothetical protein
MFRLFQSAALHGLTMESSAHVAEARTSSRGRADLDQLNDGVRGTSAAHELKYRLRLGCGCVFLAELIDAAAGVDNFLLAGIERVAIGANFDLQILADGRTRLELVPAGARDRDLFVIGMDAGFHGNLVCLLRQNRSASLSRNRIATPWALKLLARSQKSMPKTGPRIICARPAADKAYRLHIFVHNNCG